MSTYAIGDLQGCLASFERLVERLPQAERLVIVGDLVNRGPQSLATLRRVKALVDAGKAAVVLGNHDLHLLAVAAGIRPIHRNDTMQEILDAPDRATPPARTPPSARPASPAPSPSDARDSPPPSRTPTASPAAATGPTAHSWPNRVPAIHSVTPS